MHPFFPSSGMPQAGLLLETSAFAALPVGAQYAFAIIFGLVIGSFVTMLVHRLPIMLEQAWQDELDSIARASGPEPAMPMPTPPTMPTMPTMAPMPTTPDAAGHEERAAYNLWVPRSACPDCGHQLRAWENLPLLGYLLLRGRCAACGVRISWRYPALEAASAALAALSLAAFGPGWQALAAFGLSAALLAAGAIDARTRLLPDALTLPLLWAGLLVNLHHTFATIDAAVIGAVAGYLTLWLVYWAFRLLRGREGMGYGDFKLLAAIGAWTGWAALPQILLVSSLAGAAVGIAMCLRKRRRFDQPLPFGPFLAAGGLCALFLGTPFYSPFYFLFGG